MNDVNQLVKAIRLNRLNELVRAAEVQFGHAV